MAVIAVLASGLSLTDEVINLVSLLTNCISIAVIWSEKLITDKEVVVVVDTETLDHWTLNTESVGQWTNTNVKNFWQKW